MALPLSGTNYIDALLMGKSWTGTVGQAATVYYNFISGTPTGLQNAYKAALQEWANVANINFVQGGSQITLGRADLSVLGAGVAGVTFISPSSGDTLWGANVFIDDYFNSNQSVADGTHGYLILMHEIGHALGLEHPGDYGQGEQAPHLPDADDDTDHTIMSYHSGTRTSPQYWSAPASPMVYDIAAIQHLYGANTSYNSGDNLYSLESYNFTTIWDGGGNDTLTGSGTLDLREGAENYSGWSWNTYVWIAHGANIENAIGDSSRNTIYGNQLNNYLAGMDGNDVLYGFNGYDTLVGGMDHDVYYLDSYASTYTLIELPNEGWDFVLSEGTYTLGDNFEDLWLQTTFLNYANVDGTGNVLNNMIIGNLGNNRLYGLDGNDTLSSQEGNDTLEGGDGNDVLSADIGNDVLDGGTGDDTMSGGAGNDIFYVDSLNDVLGDTSGFDTVYTSIAFDRLLYPFIEDVIFITDGLYFRGSAFANMLLGNANGNILEGLAGNDTLQGEDGSDTIYGGAGADSVYGGDGADKLYADELAPLTRSRDTNYVNGGTGNDSIYGGFLTDTLEGGDGDDTIYGDNNSNGASRSNDTIYGGEGDDTIYGENGGDSLFGGAGNDRLMGDILSITGFNDRLYGEAGSDTLDGGSGNDTLFGGDDNDVLYGERGNDSLLGGAQNDLLNGSEGNDTLFGEAGNDTLQGEAGSDRLFGGAQNDTLDGSDGNDTLFGEAGDDLLQGGAGRDFFVFNGGQDTISDFEGAGRARIDMIQIHSGVAGALTTQQIANLVSYVGLVGYLDFGGGNTLTIHASGTLTSADFAII